MELLISEILWIVLSAFIVVGVTVLVLYRKLLPSLLLSRVKQKKRRLHLPDFSTVVTVFVFLLIVLVLLTALQMSYERSYTVGWYVPTDFFLFKRRLYSFDTLASLLIINFLEAGLFYVYDCILYKSFKRVGFSFLPLSLFTLFAYLIFQQMNEIYMYLYVIMIILLLLANMIVPLLKIVTVKRSKWETVFLLFRGVWRTAAMFMLAYFAESIFNMIDDQLLLYMSYFAVVYMIALIFSLTDAVVKTLKFFSEFASAERTIKRLNDVQEDRVGLEAVFELDEEERMERAALDESIIALKDYPPRFFILYDWILAWRFPKTFELWKNH